MIAVGLKIARLTVSAFTNQNHKRNGVYQNEEGNDLCNADSLWHLRLHGNIFLPQSHRGLRRYVFHFLFIFSIVLKAYVFARV